MRYKKAIHFSKKPVRVYLGEAKLNGRLESGAVDWSVFEFIYLNALPGDDFSPRLIRAEAFNSGELPHRSGRFFTREYEVIFETDYEANETTFFYTGEKKPAGKLSELFSVWEREYVSAAASFRLIGPREGENPYPVKGNAIIEIVRYFHPDTYQSVLYRFSGVKAK